MASRAVEFIINLKDNLSGALNSAGKNVASFEQRMTKATESTANLAKAFAIFDIAKRAFAFGSDLLNEYDTAANAQAQLNATLTSTKHIAGLTSEELNKQAEALSKLSRYDDDAITGMQSLLLTFTNIRGEIVTNATPAILDMASKMGSDLQGNAILVGKALNDPIKGISALTRVGVSFTEQQKKTIATMVKMGDTAGAQKLILKELETEFGGSALAAAKAGKGPLVVFQNALGNIREELGELIAKGLQAIQPYLDRFLEWMKGAIAWMKEHKELLKYIAIGLGIAAVAIGVLTVAQWALNAAMNANPISLIILAIAALVAGIMYAYKHCATFRHIMQGIGKVFGYVWKAIKWAWGMLMKFIKAMKKIADATGLTKALGVAWDAVKWAISKVGDALSWIYKHTVVPMKDAVIRIAAALNGISFEEAKKRVAAAEAKEQAEQDAEDAAYERGDGGSLAEAGKFGFGGKGGGIGPDGQPIGGGEAKTPKISQLESRAPKVININIKSLIENFKTEANTYNQSIGDLAEAVSKVLISAVNDANRIQG